jgi:hypothetical protein
MTNRKSPDDSKGINLQETFKGWLMAALTFVFVLLYAGALFGWIKPLTDNSVVTRLEPIIFVIVGYYFGRLPAQQNEKTLKEEISRQTQKTDAAQHAKEMAKQDREALEEKIKNARTSLLTASRHSEEDDALESMGEAAPPADVGQKRAIDVAINILNS